MTEGSEKNNLKVYEIKISGHLEDRWADWFEGLTFTHESDGTTILSGPIKDQTALRGILNHISDLGLVLISVQSGNSGKKRSE
jgi:hypothetical protein